MAQPSSLLDDELSPTERQRFTQALNDAVHPITLDALRATNASARHGDVLVKRTLAMAEAGRRALTQMGHAHLVEEWFVHRYQQDMALTLITTNGLDASTTLATWAQVFGGDNDVMGAAASLPFTGPRGREPSLVDLLARHPAGHDAAKTLLTQRARGVGARALTSAIHHRCEDLLYLLLNAGAPANGHEHAQDLNDLPLATGTAVRDGDDPVEVRAFNERCWDELVAWGANVNRQVRGHSLLMMAIGQRDAAHARWLIDQGASMAHRWETRGPNGPITLGVVDLIDRWAGSTENQTISDDLRKVFDARTTVRQAQADERAMQDAITTLVAPTVRRP